jgi:hypothetical protein
MKKLSLTLQTLNAKASGQSVLVHGPSGTGKTLGACLILKKLGFRGHEIVHKDAASLRINTENTHKVRLELQKTLASHGFNPERRMALILDNVVGSYPTQDSASSERQRHSALLKVLAKLLNDEPNHRTLLVIIADKRVTPEIRNLSVTATVQFYKPRNAELLQLATDTNKRHKLGLSSEQLKEVCRSAADFHQLLIQMHLLKLDPAGSLAKRDGTGQSNVFEDTRCLFTRKLASSTSQFEDRVESTGLRVFAGLIHQNYPGAVQSTHEHNLDKDAPLQEVDLMSQMADDVACSDVLAANSTDFQNWRTDRVGSEISTTHLVMAAQQTVIHNNRQRRGKMDITFPKKLLAMDNRHRAALRESIKNRGIDQGNGHAVLQKSDYDCGIESRNDGSAIISRTANGRTMLVDSDSDSDPDSDSADSVDSDSDSDSVDSDSASEPEQPRKRFRSE